MPAALYAPPAPRAGCGACLTARAHQTGVLALDASHRPVGERELLVTRRSSASGGAGATATPLVPRIGATLAALAVARQAQRRGLVHRGMVALAAKAKAAKKKKGKGNQAAVQAALEALQQLEEQTKVPAKVKKHRPGAANKDNGHAKPAEPEKAEEPAKPAVVAEAPAAASETEEKVEQKDEKDAVDAPADVPEEVPPVAEAPVEEPPAKEEKEEQPQAELTPEPAPKEPEPKEPEQQEKEVPAAPQPEEAPPPPKPAPRSALQDAFAALADIDAPVPAPSVAPEQKAPAKPSSPGDDLMAAFMAPAPSDTKADDSGVDDLASAFLTSMPTKTAAPPPEETVEDFAVSEDAADADELEEDADEDEDSDDDDEIREPIKRRRGDQDLVSFEMETGGLEGMVSVGLKNVVMRLGGRLILQDASWVVRTGDKMALVGANGCGKTTQLNILTGDMTADEGEVMMNRKNIRMAVLSQGFVDELVPERTLEEELLAAVPKESAVLKDIADVQKKIDEAGEGSEEVMELIDQLTALQDKADELKAYDLDARMNSILAKVGFLREDLSQTVGLFSGGWKVRIGLSKIFMTAPDVLLLDEPTNHLDLQSVEWLEQFLYKQTLPIVLVSHDREFMDRVCNRTVETVEGMTYTYKGGYSEYIKQRDEKMAIWRKKYAVQEKQVKEIEKFIKVNRGSPSMANARNRKIADLEKWKASDKWLDPPPRYARRIKFNFPEPPKARRGTKMVSTLAEMSRVTHGYGEGADSLLLKEADLAVRNGDKIGIIGRNGSGKSTLLRLLMGQEKPSHQESGYIMPCDPEKTRFFTQHQADLLPPDMSALAVVEDANEIGMDNRQLIEIMRKFRFKGDRLDIQCKDLSGGEKARLAIVRMMLSPSQLLIFDEPTNHLDVPMKETLEYSLREFDGAAVIVSHDRWFLSQTCETIVEIKDGEVVKYNGDFRHYMDRNPDVKQKIESHYARNSQAIGPVPVSKAERRKMERGGLKKNHMRRKRQERKDLINSVFGGGGRRR